MMKKTEEIACIYRPKIDDIDRRLVALLNERAEIAIKVGEIKHQNKMRVHDPLREKQVIEKLENHNESVYPAQFGKESLISNKSLKQIIKLVIRSCKKAEKESVVILKKKDAKQDKKDRAKKKKKL